VKHAVDDMTTATVAVGMRARVAGQRRWRKTEAFRRLVFEDAVSPSLQGQSWVGMVKGRGSVAR
jgi:hypothetical protein